MRLWMMARVGESPVKMQCALSPLRDTKRRAYRIENSFRFFQSLFLRRQTLTPRSLASFSHSSQNSFISGKTFKKFVPRRLSYSR